MEREEEFWLGDTPGVVAGRLMAGEALKDILPSEGEETTPISQNWTFRLNESEGEKFCFYKTLSSIMAKVIGKTNFIIDGPLTLFAHDAVSFAENVVVIEQTYQKLIPNGFDPISVPVPVKVYQEATKTLRNKKTGVASPLDIIEIAANKLQWINDQGEIKGFAETCFYTPEEAKEFQKILDSMPEVPLKNKNVVGKHFYAKKSYGLPDKEEVSVALQPKRQFKKSMESIKVQITKRVTPKIIDETIEGSKFTWLSEYFSTGLTKVPIERQKTKRRLLEKYGLPILYFGSDRTMEKKLEMLGEFEKDFPEVFAFIKNCLEKRIPGFAERLEDNPLGKSILLDELETLTDDTGSYLPSLERAKLVKCMVKRKPYPLSEYAKKQIGRGNFFTTEVALHPEPAWRAMTAAFNVPDSYLTGTKAIHSSFSHLRGTFRMVLSTQAFLRGLQKLYGIPEGAQIDDLAKRAESLIEKVNDSIVEMYCEASGMSDKEKLEKRKFIRENFPLYSEEDYFLDSGKLATYFSALKKSRFTEDTFEILEAWANDRDLLIEEPAWPNMKEELLLMAAREKSRMEEKKLNDDLSLGSPETLEELKAELIERGALVPNEDEVRKGSTRTLQ